MFRTSTIFLLVLACAALVACGSSSSSSDTTSSIDRQVAELEAQQAEEVGVTGSFNIEAHWTKTFSYTVNRIPAKAGKTLIGYTNPQDRPHDVAIEDPAGKTIGQSKPLVTDAESFVVQLHPGVYHYYCTLPGHREKGMEGTLVVTQ